MCFEPVTSANQRFLCDESRLEGFADGIAFPETAAALVDAVGVAARRGARLTVQGARTGLSGGAVPQGGLVVNLSRMNAAPEFIQEGNRARLRAQAGVTLERIEAAAAARGLFFPPDPTEPTATIGGMFATGASGMSGLRYGASSQFVERLRWVTPGGDAWDIARGAYRFDAAGCALPDGRRLALGGRAGGDLIDFLAGSEGRWGIAAELELALLPLPKECWGVVYFFVSAEAALAFAHRLAAWRREHGGLLFAAEYYNEEALALAGASRGASPQALPDFPGDARAALYVELRGDDGAALEEALEAQLAMFAAAGGNDAHTWAETGASVRRLRGMRHALVEALQNRPGALEWEADIAAPPEKFGEYLEAYARGMREHSLRGAVYGHLLQNRMHAALLPHTADEKRAALRLLSLWAGKAVRDGGVLAAEYGVGRRPRPWLDGALSEEIREARRAVKAFFDPAGRMGE